MSDTFKTVDVYIQSATLPKLNVTGWTCNNIYNRGTRVGPDAKISCHMTDVFQCRFEMALGASRAQIAQLLGTLSEQGFRWMDVHPIL